MSQQDHGIVQSNDLTRPKGVDQINMFELIQYIQESKLAYKIEGYAAHVEAGNEQGKAGTSKPSSPVLHSLVSFLVALTNPSSEGRIFYQKVGRDPIEIQLSYLLLSPTHAFSSITSSARAVILAGGTMSPFEDYKNHLFPTLSASKLTTLSCGHVIPRENLCVWTLAGTRPGGTTFEFSYQRRGEVKLMQELGLSLLNICSVVPDGVVVFFPSYAYLDEVVAAWSKPSQSNPPDAQRSTLWDRLQGRKQVFRESKDCSSDVVLQEYSQAILGSGGAPDSSSKASPRGALLLSVVGGKMSEGINFSDRLGRCVIVVGLPYPNIASPEWKAKMEYVETTTLASLIEHESGRLSREQAAVQAKQAARDFYENACMRAVNQSIGRAIRHKGDYAAIVLVDKRYTTDRILSKLPGWIRSGMTTRMKEGAGSQNGHLLGGLMGALGSFFRGKQAQR